MNGPLRVSEKFLNIPEGKVVTRIKEQYAETGSYPLEDLVRILGDPNGRLEVGSRESVLRHMVFDGRQRTSLLP